MAGLGQAVVARSNVGARRWLFRAGPCFPQPRPPWEAASAQLCQRERTHKTHGTLSQPVGPHSHGENMSQRWSCLGLPGHAPLFRLGHVMHEVMLVVSWPPIVCFASHWSHARLVVVHYLSVNEQCWVLIVNAALLRMRVVCFVLWICWHVMW